MKPVPDLKSLGYVPDFTGLTLENKAWRLRDHLRRTNIVLIFAHDLECGFCADFIAAAADDGALWRGVPATIKVITPGPVEGLPEWAAGENALIEIVLDPRGDAERAFEFAQLGDIAPPYVFVVDRYSTLHFHDLDEKGRAREQERALLSDVEFLEKVCPECGIYQPPPAVGE